MSKAVWPWLNNLEPEDKPEGDKPQADKPPEEKKEEIPPEEKNEAKPEEKNDIPPEESKKAETEVKSVQIFTDENMNYNETWKKKLDSTKEKFTVKMLNSEEERVLVECIRFSFLSHSDLLSLSIDPIIQNHKDLVMNY